MRTFSLCPERGVPEVCLQREVVDLNRLRALGLDRRGGDCSGPPRARRLFPAQTRALNDARAASLAAGD
jgi:hypothetical protein